MISIPQSVTCRVELKAYLTSDHLSDATGKTLAVKISKNGAAFGDPSAGATNATEIATGWYYVDLSTTDTATTGPLIVRGTATATDNAETRRYVSNAHNGGFDGVPSATAGATNGLPLAVDSSGRVDTLKINGTSQTARDLGASVLISPGTGTGQLDVTTGVIKASLVQILGTALTETSGLIAAGFKQFFNIASPTSTMNTITTVTTTTTATNLTNAPGAGDFTAAMKTSLNAATPAVTVSDKTGFSLSAAGVQAVWDALTSVLTTVGSVGKRIADFLTGDSYARIGAAGAGLTALGDTRVANLDATITSRTKPADTQAAVTTTTNLTNAPGAGDFTATMKTSLSAATPAVTVSDKTGFSLSAAGVQAVWDALTSVLTTVGSVGKRIADFLTGDSYARIGAAGAGLTALGDTRVANLDATITSRTKPADTQAAVTTLTTYTGNTPQTGDSFSRIGAPVGASISADLAAVPTANVNADALLKRDMSAISGEAAHSLINILRGLGVKNKTSISNGVLTVFKEDAVSIAYTVALTTDSGALPVVGTTP